MSRPNGAVCGRLSSASVSPSLLCRSSPVVLSRHAVLVAGSPGAGFDYSDGCRGSR